MTKLLQSDWLRGVQLFHQLHSPGVQLMIFVMAGGSWLFQKGRPLENYPIVII
jgi:hypothetical protein